MGANESLPPLPDDCEYFSILFHAMDKVITVHADGDVNEQVRQLIGSHFPEVKIEETTDYGGARCFKFEGLPFISQSDLATAKINSLIARLVSELRIMGWKLDLTACIADLFLTSSLFFRKVEPPKSKELLCVILNGGDKIQVRNCQDNFVWNGIKEACLEFVPDKLSISDNYKLIKLKDSLWKPKEPEIVHKARKLLLNVMQRIYSRGYSFYGRANPFGGSNRFFELLFFEKNPAKQDCNLIMLGVSENNKIQLYGGTEASQCALRDAVRNYWYSIASDTMANDFMELQLSSTPWFSEGEAELQAKQLITEIIDSLHSCGWSLEACPIISNEEEHKTVFIFSSSPAPKSSSFCCLSPLGDSSLRVVYTEQKDQELVNTVFQALENHWGRGLKYAKCEKPFGKEKTPAIIKCNGCLWMCLFGGGVVLAHHVYIMLLWELRKVGWSPLGAAGLVKGNTNVTDADTSQSVNLDNVFFAKEN